MRLLVALRICQHFSPRNFRTDKCFKLGWPMDSKADFFVHSEGRPASNPVIYNLCCYLCNLEETINIVVVCFICIAICCSFYKKDVVMNCMKNVF